MTTRAMRTHLSDDQEPNDGRSEMSMSYGRFAAMIATSTAVMFAFMYLNTYQLSHIRWSETRVYMAVLMGSTMAVIMLAFMLGMYRNRK